MCICCADVVLVGKNLYNNEHVAIKLVILSVMCFCMMCEVTKSVIKVTLKHDFEL